MKTELVGELTQENKIDWSKKQILVCLDESYSNTLIASNRLHDFRTFEGMLIHGYTGSTMTLDFRKDWVKAQFKPITHPITIMFENE